jgi:hypothetical protein
MKSFVLEIAFCSISSSNTLIVLLASLTCCIICCDNVLEEEEAVPSSSSSIKALALFLLAFLTSEFLFLPPVSTCKSCSAVESVAAHPRSLGTSRSKREICSLIVSRRTSLSADLTSTAVVETSISYETVATCYLCTNRRRDCVSVSPMRRGHRE